MNDDSVPVTMQLVAIYLALSGGYHLADGVSMFSGGVGGLTLNILFAGLSVVLGVGLLLSAGGLFFAGSGSWFLGAGLVVLFTVLLDVMSVVLRQGVASALDGILLLLALGVVVYAQSGEKPRADMDEEDSVHSLSDYP